MESKKDTSFLIIILLIIIAAAILFWLLIGGSFVAPTEEKYEALQEELGIIAAPENGYGVQVKNDASLGAYLAGPNSKTLYTTTLKECDAKCLSLWPPYIVSASQETSGALGTIRFGTVYQQTYNSIPLYYYSGDEKAGDINGHAKGGVWFVARP